MKTMREKFEGLEKIKDILEEYKSDVITFDEENGEYKATLYSTFVPEYIEWLNGAWYAFQEQEKKIGEHNRKLNLFLDELKKTHNDDKDNKIDYWRGFSDCADSFIKVFLRDIGFID